MADDFHEVSIPNDFEKGMKGGSGFHTTVLVLSSGKEKRNIDWQDARASYTIGYGLRNITLVRELISFHRARRGRAYGFRMTDWMDYQIPFPGYTAQVIGTGDGTTAPMQFVKTYGDSGGSYIRTVTKPVNNSTLQMTINNVPVTEGVDYSVDYTTGLWTPTVLVPIGHEVAIVYCEFEVPVRFEDDNMEVTIEQISSGSWSGVKVVEVPI